MPCSAVVLVLLRDRNDGGEHGMRKTRVFGQLLGVQGTARLTKTARETLSVPHVGMPA